jgi:hypothetical protein
MNMTNQMNRNEIFKSRIMNIYHSLFLYTTATDSVPSYLDAQLNHDYDCSTTLKFMIIFEMLIKDIEMMFH